jgi:dihydropteroate synthase
VGLTFSIFVLTTTPIPSLAPRLHYEWRLRDRTVHLGERTLIMAVLNVTPDSFSDGGLYATPGAAIAHGLRLLDEGADILDIGGESTRPGATFVAAEIEIERVLPVLTELRRLRKDAVFSVDTSKSEVARAAVAAGAEIVNDVSGLLWDDAMAPACAALGCGVVATHTRGRPDVWKHLPALRKQDVLPLVRGGLLESLERARAAGIRKDALALDPGFGFGKTGEENYWLLARMAELAELDRPILAGLSRKSFLGRSLAQVAPSPDFAARRWEEVSHDAPPAQLLPQSAAAAAPSRSIASVAATVAAVLNGAHIVRVHEVKPALEAVTIADAILRAA